MKNLILLTIYLIASLAFADTPRKIEAGEYFFNAPTGSNKIKLSAPALGANRSYKLPAADGSANDCLKTDGAGQMAFSPCAKVDLSNLTTTSIPVALLPSSNNTNDIGSSSLIWANINGRFFNLFEDPANGTNKAVLKAPATLASDTNFTLPSDNGTAGYVLQTDGSGNTSWTASGGGGGTPGGVDKQIQFNDGGSFGGASIYWDKTNKYLTINDGTGSSTGTYPFWMQRTAATNPMTIENLQNSGTVGINLFAKNSIGVARTAQLEVTPIDSVNDSYLSIKANSTLTQTNYGNGLISLGSGSNIKQTLPTGNTTVEITSSLSSAALNILGANASEGPEINFTAANGTAASPTSTAANKILADLRFQGYTGSQPAGGALIRAQQTGAITSNNAPSKILFYQTNDSGVFNNTWEMNRNGVLFGYFSHNPSGASSFGPTAPGFYSGTYTPTLSSSVNCGTIGSNLYVQRGSYLRVANTVQAGVDIVITSPAGGLCTVNITLPVNLTVAYSDTGDISGSGISDLGYVGTIRAINGSLTQVEIRMPNISTSAQHVKFNYQYTVQ